MKKQINKLKLLFILLLTSIVCFHCGTHIPVDKSIAFNVKDSIWKNFRENFPFHIQTFCLFKDQVDNSKILIISEPPPHVKIYKMEKIFKDCKVEIKEHKIGHDGWTKDIVIVTNSLEDDDIKDKLTELNEYVFQTEYKPYYLTLPMNQKPKQFLSNTLNYEINSDELSKWFLENKELLFDTDNRESTLPEVLEKHRQGVFYSKAPGFVLWVLPINNDINNREEEIRRFFLDSDLLLGAIKDNNTIAIIARERICSVFDLPPLRSETALQLAYSNDIQLQQSYERNSLLAGKLKDENDWAPIFLSNELINTEYGSLLNITDQMLKSWSQNGRVKYENFDYDSPDQWAFRKPVVNDLHVNELTFNWNTYGASYSFIKNKIEFISISKTGALPVSYLPSDSSIDKDKIIQHELDAYDYFANLNNPNLIRALQYSFLYQIFKRANIQYKEGKTLYKDYGYRIDHIDYMSKMVFDINEKMKSPSPLSLELFEMLSTSEIVLQAKSILEEIENTQGRDGLKRFAHLLVAKDFETNDFYFRDKYKVFLNIWSLFKDYYDLKILGFDLNEIMLDYVKVSNNDEKYKPLWIKTPSVVISKNIVNSELVYGGHNIDAVIPKLIVEENMKNPGFYKVTKGPKGLVISGDIEDINNISIKSLEEAGRIGKFEELGESKLFKIAKNNEAHLLRERTSVIPVINKSERGFSAPEQIVIEKLKRGFEFNGKNIDNCTDLINEIKNQKANSLELKFINFSEDEAKVVIKSTEIKYSAQEVILKKGETFDINPTKFDFGKVKISIEESDILISVPKTTNGAKAIIKLKNVSQEFLTKIKEIINNLIRRMKNEHFNFLNEFDKDLKANNIPFENIEIELADCSFCINSFYQSWLNGNV